MATFELDPGAVAQTEQVLIDTGEAVNTEARNASDSITGLSGAGWSGAANTAASHQQTGPFADAVTRLHNEINHMSEALGLGRAATTSEDDASEQALTAVNPDVGSFGRLAV